VQCEVTATNAGGSVVAVTRGRVVLPEPSVTPPASEEVTATAASAGETEGPVSVADQLPEGIDLAGTSESSEVFGMGWRCTIANGGSAVTCKRSDDLDPGDAYPTIALHVHVSAGAASSSTNVVAVSGGGAATMTASDRTTVAEAVPFGISTFTTSVTEELGNPFSQAGGHPFSANTTFVFNFVPGDEGNLETAGGSPRDIETALPPGFVGNPMARPRCPIATFEDGQGETPCPSATAVGYIHFSYAQGEIVGGVAQPIASTPVEPIFNLEPTSGSAASFGFVGGLSYARFTLNARVRSDGDYGVTIGSPFTAKPTLLGASLTFCEGGASYALSGGGVVESASCDPPAGFTAATQPLLTNPTQCAGRAPVTRLSASSYQDPANYASITSYTDAVSASPAFQGDPTSEATPVASSFVTGCDLLQFNPGIELAPSVEGGTSQADEPTGASFDLKVPQSEEDGTNATPALKDATVTLPEGMTVDPSAADGLQACSDAQFGLGSKVEPVEPADCPAASRVGTVVVKTPLLEKPLEGQVFVGEPECSPCTNEDTQDGRMFRLFLQVSLPERGVVVKLAGKVSANPVTGRLQATFTEQPQLPFGELELKLDGGPRAPLATPQACGEAKTTSVLTPWSSEPGSNETQGTPDAMPSSSFDVDWDGHGGACPSSIPFSPAFTAQTSSSAAGLFTPFTVSLRRGDREQDLSGVTVNLPNGLLGMVSEVSRCVEPQAAQGECPESSRIGTTTVGAGAGSHPFYLSGSVYLTGPYKGAPFGLSVVVPAKAGPFTLAGTNGQGDVVVRAAISVNPNTAAVSIASDSFPQIVDGVPLRLRDVQVTVDRAGSSMNGFVFNPTNCSAQNVTATISGEHLNNGEANKSESVSSPFAAGGCSGLPFSPSFSASTQGATSKADGASLIVKVASSQGQANIAKVDLQLPRGLPARLTTLQKACTEAQFNTNPAGCQEASVIGMAKAITPVLNVPLTGPAYLVSHGGAAFPDVEFVLQGEGVRIDLDGGTDIKNGVTYSRFESIPDAPISSFEAVLPEGPHSVLATDIPAKAKNSLCGQSLTMPSTITAQNGKQIIQMTKIAVTGCTKVKTKTLTRAQKLAKALKSCKKKPKKKRTVCERQARKKYGKIERSKKTNRRRK
jgi:hypothetical protein